MIPFNALSTIIILAVVSTSDGLHLDSNSVHSSLPPVSQSSSGLEVALREWADEVRHVAEKASAQSVVVTITNQNYRDRFDEVLNSFGKMAGAPLAVVALDEETEQFFRGRGVTCFWLNPEKFDLPHWLHPGYPIKEQVMRGKFEVTAHLLEAGLQVVFTDMDIYWKRNPLTLLSDFAVDFLVTQHSFDHEINIGFYIARPTPIVKHIFNKVRDWIVQPNRHCGTFKGCGLDVFKNCGCMDQKILDFAVRGPNATYQSALVSKCGFPGSEQAKLFDTESSSLNWAYIPFSLLPHWPFQNVDVEHDDSVVAVHVWSAMGNAKAQMIWATQHGFWDSGSPVLPDEQASVDTHRAQAADGDVCGCDDFTS